MYIDGLYYLVELYVACGGLVFVYPFTWYDLLVTVYTMYTLVHNFVRRC